MSLALPVTLLGLPSTGAAAVEPVKVVPAACAGMTPPQEEDHASIRVDAPEHGAEVAVDEEGKIDLAGVLHKHATMVDVSVGKLVTTDFTFGPPPDGVANWGSSWKTRLRPPELGTNLVCTRAERQPKRHAQVLRSIKVVDNIPPSNVSGLTVGDVTAYSAKASWAAATDNYGLGGYEITVDGGVAHRTNSGTRSYTITGLAPETEHTVSVVAVDLAGNRSPTPATATFRTAKKPPEPVGLKFDPGEGGALATWHPDPAYDVTYRAFLDGALYEEFSLKEYCEDAAGNPADPCTADSIIGFPIEPLEEQTSHTFRVDAIDKDGKKVRDFGGEFITAAVEPAVPEAVVQQVTSEGSQCSSQGGDFYIAPSLRGKVEVPAGARQLFEGCYAAADASCIEDNLPLDEDKKLDCDDDVTDMLKKAAPPGKGPAVGHLDGIASAVEAQFVPGGVQTVAWCAQSACALLLAPPTVAVETAAAAAGTSAVATFVVVTIVGVVIGVALGVIWAILFPTPIAIGGLLEYPIHHDDDLTKFDDWHLDKGRWYNSLKVWQQVITTTKEVTARDTLPFAWDDSEDAKLKRIIDAACTAQRGTQGIAACDDDVVVYVPGGRTYGGEPLKETGTHIVEALGNGSYPQPPGRAKWFYPGRSQGGKAAVAAGYDHKWYDDNPRFQPNVCNGRVAKTCDEFPFWASDQAVDLTGLTASLKVVPKAETLPQAHDLSAFYGKCKVKDTDKFIVLPIKPWVEANGPSFGFRVNPGGTDLCMKPKVLP
ncbi:NucA/NucB deoxyribonuclease domain-containing protein [Streptomyces mesophilus]|uniref:NucA/NucB deoxyribonuclease domain-containing protein n=1 Tax=Streptomyces mesophilus TaxID=1775132 RepID=UPI0019D16748|nr:fibronectin type III domain-containing protein [Streptomyces mesophilus]